MPAGQQLPVATWDATQYVVIVTPTVGPSFRVVGPAKGTFVEVARMTDAFSSDAGANGDVVRSYNADQRGTVKLTVQQTSPSNDLLSNIGIADEQSGKGLCILALEDISGRSISSGASAWLKRISDGSFAVEAGDRVWEFEVAQLRHFIGGAV